MPNRKIGGYSVLSEIGSGGYGAVYRARDPLNDRDVALKALPKIANSDDLTRFRREVLLARETDHPNVIRIFDCGEDGGACFIAMELMPTSLREILGNGRLPLSKALDIFRQAALGLRAAHERGVVHLDVKPDNILLDSAGAVKVSDFGLAGAEDLRAMTVYRPLELWRGERVDVRSDIYSLGVVLHETLTGEAPPVAPGKASAKRIRPGVPTGLARIVEKCAALDPKRRFQTMDELIESISLELINRCVLTDFYEATNGDNWERKDNWLTDAPLGDWHGVISSRDGLECLRLYIEDNGLSGGIPPELGNLTKLKVLNLADNRLSGGIPPELSNLTKLKVLALDGNRLSGGIPPELGNLTKLKVLSLSGNRLSGSVPPELGNLTELEQLYIGENRLSRIPPELGGLTKLYEVELGGNNWTGCIPRALIGVPKNDIGKISLPVCDC